MVASRTAYLPVLAALLVGSFSFPAAAQLGEFKCPMEGKPQIRQGDVIAKQGGRFDSKRGEDKKHGALDLNGKVGDTVKAALDGRAAVAATSWGEMGNTVIIDHGAGAYTIYGHLDAIVVKEGDKVVTGQKIGTVGYSGNAAALKAANLPPHLHFAMVQAGQTGLADKDKPLRKMKEWGDYWKDLGAELTGIVNPNLFMGGAGCWSGSPNVGAEGEH